MSLNSKQLLILALLIWAGAAIGANLVATPAKFLVADLTRPVALQVGRMQFLWVGYVEYTLAAVALLTLPAVSPAIRAGVGFAIVILIIQRLGVLPQLSARTDLIVAGQSIEASQLHIVFIVLEALKVCMLSISAVWVLNVTTSRSEKLAHVYD